MLNILLYIYIILLELRYFIEIFYMLENGFYSQKQLKFHSGTIEEKVFQLLKYIEATQFLCVNA